MPQSNVPIRVFLADDSALIRSRVRLLLESAGSTVVGQGETPQGCIDAILAFKPDVVVLDVQLEGGPGLDVLRAVRQVSPGVGFVVFSNNCAPAYRKRYLQEGALSFLDKSTESGELVQAVAQAARHAVIPTPTTSGGHHVHSNP